MQSQLLINSTFKETRVALLENNKLTELFIERRVAPLIVGSIYKGKVGKVVPGMQAAFVEIGTKKAGFISVEDVYEESFIEFFLDEKDFKQTKNSQQLIQDVLKEGQEVIVQVIKEPVFTKGAKLTSYIGIPGKYLVLLGTVDMVGISRKIDDDDERKRLFNIISSNKPNDIGFIARTACINVEENEIIDEIKYLIRFWKKIKNKSEKSPAPSKIHEEPSLYIRAVRDLLSNDISKIIIDTKKNYNEIKKYFSKKLYGKDFPIELYSKNDPLFKKFNIEEQIKKIYQKKVWLKSGGYLIIDEAEGLSVIDVNTGKFTGGEDQEETIFMINQEAALESARQIRLRNLVGIIVIDFIDLRNTKSRDKIFEIFSEELKKDRSRTVIQDISLFGVIQLTRQRVRESILSMLTDTCHFCSGTGKIKSVYTICYEILREIQYKSKLNNNKTLAIYANTEAVNKLKEIEGKNIRKIQRENNIKIKYKKTQDMLENFNIVVE
ncbi:MAG: Rne/Rng family ribonuclease [Thermodesulfobacteriota bacterium]